MITVDHPLTQFLTELTRVVITMLAVVYPRHLGNHFSGKRIATGIQCCSEPIDEPVYRHNHSIHASNWHMNGSA